MAQVYRLGIFETVFPRATLAERFEALQQAGFASVQFDLESAAIDPWAGPVSQEAVAGIAAEAGRTQVAIPAVSGTYNMAHPDPAVRAAGHEGLARVIAVAPSLGASFATLCTGSRSTESMWKEHPENASASAWNDCRDSILAALAEADRYEITLLVEPEPANVVGSAVLARRMLDEIGHPRLRIVLDPANIVLSDLTQSPADVLDRAFDLLAPDIVFAHAKDLSSTGRFCAAGTGVVQWQHYRALLDGIEYQGDVIFHTLSEPDIPRALQAWNGIP